MTTQDTMEVLTGFAVIAAMVLFFALPVRWSSGLASMARGGGGVSRVVA